MKELDLGKEKINKLLIAFSIPCIISMLINSVYNIVDQIFIGKGVGTIGNAATNVIFPLIIMCNAFAGLIGNGAAANLSLRLGENDLEDAKKSIGNSIVLLIIISILIAVLGEIFLPTLVNAFGCTKNVYPSAITYGRIILIGAPFMIMYSGLSSIIRADGSPKYSMICLVVGAIINLILDPIFILGFDLGVAGGAVATIIGQFVSFIIAVAYLFKLKTIKLEKKDFILSKEVFKTLSLGLSSFITQMTVLALFVVMNNIMTKAGVNTKFGADIPLSVYGIVSKVNSIFISCILGISIGSQPIIGFNYGAGNYKRVKETLRKVFLIAFVFGLIYNLTIVLFPKQIISIFISQTDPTYDLFMEFAIDFCRIFMIVCAINVFEMCTSITVQSLGNFKKATLVSFTRQIILFIPIALILTHFKGLYGALYAGPIADSICFVLVIFIFMSEYKKITRLENKNNIFNEDEIIILHDKLTKKVVITIAREYGSGGRYVGQMVANKLGIKFYDKEIINMAAKESGLSIDYINNTDEKKSNIYSENNDKIFIAESKVIKKISKESCVIVGRCADYVLKNNKDTLKVFIYSNDEDKIKRATKYYGLDKDKSLKIINKINRERSKHYEYYTNRKWNDLNNYDIAINVSSCGVEKSADIIEKIVLSNEIDLTNNQKML